jgi:hypothetical protein
MGTAIVLTLAGVALLLLAGLTMLGVGVVVIAIVLAAIAEGD